MVTGLAPCLGRTTARTTRSVAPAPGDLARRTMHCVRTTVLAGRTTPHGGQAALQSGRSTRHAGQLTVHDRRAILHHAPVSLHPAPATVHPTPATAHQPPAPLHAAPDELLAAQDDSTRRTDDETVAQGDLHHPPAVMTHRTRRHDRDARTTRTAGWHSRTASEVMRRDARSTCHAERETRHDARATCTGEQPAETRHRRPVRTAQATVAHARVPLTPPRDVGVTLPERAAPPHG